MDRYFDYSVADFESLVNWFYILFLEGSDVQTTSNEMKKFLSGCLAADSLPPDQITNPLQPLASQLPREKLMLAAHLPFRLQICWKGISFSRLQLVSCGFLKECRRTRYLCVLSAIIVWSTCAKYNRKCSIQWRAVAKESCALWYLMTLCQRPELRTLLELR